MRVFCISIMMVVLLAGCVALRQPEPQEHVETEVAVEAAPPTAEEAVAEQARQEERRRQEDQLRAVVAAFDPVVANIVAALNERDYEKYVRDFERPWLNANRDIDRFNRIVTNMHERLGTLQDQHIQSIRRDGRFHVLFYAIRCEKVDEPLVIRFVVRHHDGVPLIMHHSLRQPDVQGQDS